MYRNVNMVKTKQRKKNTVGEDIGLREEHTILNGHGVKCSLNICTHRSVFFSAFVKEAPFLMSSSQCRKP